MMIKLFIFKKKMISIAQNLKYVKGAFPLHKDEIFKQYFLPKSISYNITYYRDKEGLMKQTHCAHTGTLMVGLQNG